MRTDRVWPFQKRKMPDPSDPEEALRHRIVRLDGEITEATAEVAIAKLLYLQYQDPEQPITLRIESFGGYVVPGMAIVDAVRELHPQVRTRAPVRAHGVAAVVLASGRSGERFVGASAELSLSPFESVTIVPEEIRGIRYRIAEVIAELCGQPHEAVAQDLLTGLDFTPAEAVAYGLADRIEG